MQPPGACQFRPVEDPSPRVTGGVDAGKKVPKASSLPFDTCARIAGMVSLRQTRRADMPDATNPFASRLAGTRIT
jgi:hypothetical protein